MALGRRISAAPVAQGRMHPRKAPQAESYAQGGGQSAEAPDRHHQPVYCHCILSD
jgi:hypothetical protein